MSLKLRHGGYYWIRSEYYRIDLCIGQYDLRSMSAPLFGICGTSEIFFADRFDVLQEVEMYSG